MKKEASNPIYSTEHLFLASFLLANDQKFMGTTESAIKTRSGGQRKTFHFEESPATGILIKEFWNNAMIGVQDYTQAQQTLKAVTRNQE